MKNLIRSVLITSALMFIPTACYNAKAQTLADFSSVVLYDSPNQLKIVAARYNPDESYFFVTLVVWCDSIEFKPVRMQLNEVDIALEIVNAVPLAEQYAGCTFYQLASMTVNGGLIQKTLEADGVTRFSIVGETKTIIFDIDENLKHEIRATFGWPHKAGL